MTLSAKLGALFDRSIALLWWLRYVLAIVAIAAVIGVNWYVLADYGLDVRVTNIGKRPMTDVIVVVTGEEYELGEVLPGESHTVRVKAAIDTGVWVAFADDGKPIALDAGLYIGRYEDGLIEVEVNDGKLGEVYMASEWKIML